MSVNQWKLISNLKEHLTTDRANMMFLVSKEWTSLWRKLPKMSSQAHSIKETSTKANQSSEEQQQSSFNPLLEGIQAINDIRARFSLNSPSTTKSLTVTGWKKNLHSKISTESIQSRINFHISSLLTAETDESRLKRLKDFTESVAEFPDAKNYAVKKGAIRVILRIRSTAKRKEVEEQSQVALTVLGYVEPPKGQGIRILSIDGGGVRGLLVLEMLKKLEQLTGKKTCELFDFICGVSTGSIIGCSIGASGKSLEEVAELYKMLSEKVFKQNAFEGARSLLWSHGYYDTSVWEQILQEHVGNTVLLFTAADRNCPKIGAISTVIHQQQVVPFIFRNYEMPYRVKSTYLGSYKYKMWEAARASAAAPAYFEEFRLDDFLHQDGGMIVNNPTAVALHEAKLLWPNKPIQCVISCGTGRVNPMKHSPSGGLNNPQLAPPPDLSKQASWWEKFSQILVSATDTEAVHIVLSDLLPSSRYFRFNPYLTEMLSMVEYQKEKLALLEQDAHLYIRRNEEKFIEAANLLTEPKSYVNACKDWLNMQGTLMGFK